MKQLILSAALLLGSLSGLQAQNITQGPADAAVCTGQGASFSVATQSAGGFQWQLLSANGWTDLADAGIYTGTATAQLVLSDVSGLNGAQYRCYVTDSLLAADTSAVATLTVYALPVAAISPVTSPVVCQGTSMVLNAVTGTGYTYQWQDASGPITGAGTSSLNITTSGNYILQVTDANGCIAQSAPMPVTVNGLPVVTVQAGGPVSVCAGESVSLLALPADPNAAYSYQWLENGQLINGATSANATFSVSGGYHVMVTDNVTGCVTTTTMTQVQVNALPAATVSLNGPATFCSGTSVIMSAPTGAAYTYQWKNNNQPISGATAASLSMGTSGAYQVVVTDAATGCTDSSNEIAITVHPVPPAIAMANGPAAVCQGDSVVLAANAGAQFLYQWMTNGTDIAGATQAGYTATASGSYAVRITNGFNCSNVSASVAVAVHPVTQALITYDDSLAFCDGGAVVLNADTAGGGMTYQWLLNGVVDPGQAGSFLSAGASGSYSVVVSNGYNCTSVSAPVSVTVFPNPQPVLSQSGSQLSTGAFAAYQWFRNNVAIGGATGPAYTATVNGAYRVVVTNANGCTSSSETLILNSLGVSNLTLNAADVKIFPTPTTGLVHIEAAEKVNVVLRNMEGRILLAQEGATVLDLSRFARGMYLLSVADDHNNLVKVEKLILNN